MTNKASLAGASRPACPPRADTRSAATLWAGIRRIGRPVLVVLAAAGAAGADYSIVGSLGELVEEGEVVLSRSTAVLGSSTEVARGTITGGEFQLSGEVVDMGRVSLSVKDAEGNSKGSTQFILEPGEIRISHAGRVAGLIADGGHYTARVVSVWRDTEEYQGVLSEYSAVMDAKRDLEEGPERDALMEEAVRFYNELTRIRRDALREIALSDDDPLASLFAIEMGGLSRAEAIDRLDQLEAVAELPKAADALRARTETGIRMAETAQTIKVGSQAKNFAAPGLNGQTYTLEDSLASNKFVLIEFWASWCGPCRAEVPTLKTALEQYGDRGFDIFAFSLDDNREDWEVASEEDDITWVNTCDLKAYDSPVPALFGVLAIPMNVIVDADGTILGKYVRGERLLTMLGELLPDQS
ncbi:MAG: TlpA disulfide reductase family protein [Gammaproteobacteria bacterium]|nr:TlpA disulfide reductase family protein [Gammaproteobacteria bacterium]